MSNFRSESHVAQQSRRDKLRIQHSSVQAEHLEHFPSNLEQLSGSPGLNPDLVQVRNVRSTNLLLDPTLFSSEMLNYSPYSSVLSAQRDAMVRQGLCAAPHYASIASPSSKPLDDPQSCNDWTVNYGSGSAGSEGNSNSMFVGQVFSNNVKLNNSFSSAQYLKPGYIAYQVSQSSLTNPSSEISSQDRQKQYAEMFGLEMASLMQQNIRESGQGLASDAGNELVLLPAHGNQSNVLRFDNCQQWSGELGYMARKSEDELRTVLSDSNTQGLSLSLSSNSHPRIHVAEFGGRYEPVELPVRTDVFKDPQDSLQKPSIINKGCGKSPQEMAGTSNYVHRTTGPLGPFTGYATILKSSKFLKPTQQLLDEFCCVKGSKVVQPCEASEKISGEASVSHQSGNADKNEAGIKGGGNSAVSSSAFYSSNEISGEGGVGSSSSESYRPEYQQKKAKLLYMQEEVCRRYKQYHQQMQMVVSSFESVAGLSAATPYISVALKTVTRHFRCLKNAISDQLKHVKTALGEDLSSPTTGTSSSKGDTNVSRLKYVDQSFLKHKPGGGNVGFLEPQQHIWRPQRGLPERSVAILRAWLFEHFLHPYPTDTDKHMLATQTGLSRNQFLGSPACGPILAAVSNWFINARVRVWKPMVEEIHMLETKGGAETNQNTSKSDGKFATEASTSQPHSDQPSNKQMERSAMASSAGTRDGLSEQQWYQEKRSRLECQIPASMDGSLMGFLPYPRNGLEMGGLGAVSLTLGLRHSAESAQQQQEDQLRRQFGGQMIHDFVG